MKTHSTCYSPQDDISRRSSSSTIGERLGALQGYLAGLILRGSTNENQFYLPPVDKACASRDKENEDNDKDGALTPASSDDDSMDYPVRNVDSDAYK